MVFTLHPLFIRSCRSGNIGVAKTYTAEVTDETNQAKGFAILSCIWGVGNIFGPAIGGFLAQPSHKWPTVCPSVPVHYSHSRASLPPQIFPRGSFFDTYQYALPCFVVSSIALIGLFTGYFFMPVRRPMAEIRMGMTDVGN